MLDATPRDGQRFSRAVREVLQREVTWVMWKKGGKDFGECVTAYTLQLFNARTSQSYGSNLRILCLLRSMFAVARPSFPFSHPPSPTAYKHTPATHWNRQTFTRLSCCFVAVVPGKEADAGASLGPTAAAAAKKLPVSTSCIDWTKPPVPPLVEAVAKARQDAAKAQEQQASRVTEGLQKLRELNTMGRMYDTMGEPPEEKPEFKRRKAVSAALCMNSCLP